MTFWRVPKTFLPHRVAGGIGLIMLAIGLASVRVFSKERVGVKATGVAGGSPVQRPKESAASAINEPEVSARSFVVSANPLPAYRVSNLAASLPPDDRVDLVALTQNGTVLATLSPPPPPTLPNGRPARLPAPRTQAARWMNNRWRRLPIPAGADRVVASDINDTGQVAAVSIRYRRGKPSYNRVLLYGEGTSIAEDVGTLDPNFNDPAAANPNRMRGVSEAAVCLNNAGTLVALVGNKSWFRRPDGSLGHLGQGAAYDLNNRHVAVGFSAGGVGNAALWRNLLHADPQSPVFLLPSRNNAPSQTVPILRGIAECVNDTGDVVVSVQIDMSSGFRRQGKTAYYFVHGKKLQQIAQMRGMQSNRIHMNRHGDVVGFVDVDQAAGVAAPFLYRRGKMYDLTNAVQGGGYRVVAAVDINDRGQILAYGVSSASDTRRPFPLLLTPPALAPRQKP